MLEGLAQTYGDRFEAVQIDIVPTIPVNVMTTWTLSKEALKKVQDSFWLRWECRGSNSNKCQPVKDEVAAAWNRLRVSAAQAARVLRSPEDSRARPPIN